MRITETWLRERVDIPVDFATLAARLVQGGFEVEASGTVGPALSGIVVGRILAVSAHPQADRLRVCQVDVGDAPVRTIVCGAPNARVNLVAPVALPGAKVGDRHIAVTDLRGVRSEGMLCSATELGQEGAPGLWELPSDAPVGSALSHYLGWQDRYLDLAITPNRGDCLSVNGIAREVAALVAGRLLPDKVGPIRVTGNPPSVQVHAVSDCLQYRARRIVDIEPGSVTPLWLAERLRQGNIKSRHPVVDATNYIMLAWGQPLHAFDAALIVGAIEVRLARKAERIALLDGSERILMDTDLIIADEQGPLALAGIMGGTRAQVTEQTTSVLVESAVFRPDVISKTARRLKLTTEAALRYERGVDPLLASRCLDRVTKLIRRTVGGHAQAAFVFGEVSTARSPIVLRYKRVGELLGVDIPKGRIIQILKALGARVIAQAHSCQVIAPSYRFDIKLEIDLVEEVARLFGYDRIPATSLPPLSAMPPVGAVRSLRRVSALLVDRDYHEAMTFSLVDPAEQEALGLPSGPVIQNPLASQWAALRVSLIPGLLAAVAHNRRRQQMRVRFFECGRCYTRTGEVVTEALRLGGVVLGPAAREQWGSPSRSVDFFDVKGDVEALWEYAGLTPISVARSFSFLQEGQSVAFMHNEEMIGFMGALHPAQRERLGFAEPVFLFEVDATCLVRRLEYKIKEVPRFPAIRRDIAIVVHEQVPARDVLRTVRENAGEFLAELVLFDVYRGEGLDLGKKSLAMGLTLQNFSRTLTDKAVEDIVARTLGALEVAYGAQLRQR